MTRIVVDKSLGAKLHELKQPAELCDESGRVLARLVPVLDESDYERIEPHLSAEELELSKQEPHLSTGELLAYLEQL